MKMDFRAIAILSFLLLTCQSVLAATASGSSPFALASLVAVHSPVLSTGDTVLIRRLFNGHFHQLRGDTKVISVEANAVVCSVGNVDLTAHSCKLTFGGKTINLTGDKAYELYATMSQAGVTVRGFGRRGSRKFVAPSVYDQPARDCETRRRGCRLYVRCCRVACGEIKPIALISPRRVYSEEEEARRSVPKPSVA